MKQRIDRLLVERGLAESREKAQAMIMAGEVLAGEQKITKAGHKVDADADLRVLAAVSKYVGRGGLKLEAALEGFGIRVDDAVCLDIGSSTGGFTDCLLQHGARKVYAVDVGTGQLEWTLRQDQRVVVCERVNARRLTKEVVAEPVDFACCDVSFISATLILPCLPPLLKPAAELVVLAKPQFEVSKGEVGKGGIVRDPALHQRVTAKVAGAIRQLGFRTVLERESPILGAEGNKEFLIYGAEREG